MLPATLTRISGPPIPAATRATDLRQVEQIAADGQPADLIGQLDQAVLAAGHHGHPGPGRGERTRQSLAQAR